MRWFGGGGSALQDHAVKEAVFERSGSDGALATQSWGQFAALHKKDESGATVFQLSRNKGDEQSVKVQSARRCVKLTKILRHLLPYRESRKRRRRSPSPLMRSYRSRRGSNATARR